MSIWVTLATVLWTVFFIKAAKISLIMTHNLTQITVKGTQISRAPCIGCGWNVYTCPSECKWVPFRDIFYINASKIGQIMAHNVTYIRVEARFLWYTLYCMWLEYLNMSIWVWVQVPFWDIFYINASKIGQIMTHNVTYIRVEGTHISRTPCSVCGYRFTEIL